MCPRMAAYQALGVEGEPHTEETERRFGRGRRIGEAMAAEIISTLESQGRIAWAEHEVPWPAADPIGIGHVDVYIAGDENIPVEVVSTKGCELPPNKARQVSGYAINLGATEARVVSVDPQTGDERVYPINVEAFRDEVENIERQVVSAVRDGVIPDRIESAHPGAWPCQGCQFAIRCFTDWTPPPAGRLPDAEDDLLRLVELERLIRQTPRGDHVIEYESERDEIRERLRGLMEPGTDYIEGGVRVRRTEVSGRRTFSFSAAEAAGFKIPESLEPFISQGKGHDKWTIREVS